MKLVKLGVLIAVQAAAAWAIVVLVVSPALRGEPLPWQDAPVEESAEAEEDAASRELGPLLQLDGILVNVAETKGRRYFKTSLTLEMEGKQLGKSAEERMPVLRGAVIDLLATKTLDQLVAPASRDTLKTEILDTLNSHVTGGQFRDLFFTEFLVQ